MLGYSKSGVRLIGVGRHDKWGIGMVNQGHAKSGHNLGGGGGGVAL